MLEMIKDLKHLPTHQEVQDALPSYRTLKDDIGNVEEAWVSDKDFANVHEVGKAFELLNREFVVALCDHIQKRMNERPRTESFVILELGAGNGRMAHFVQEELNSRAPNKAKVIAVDDGNWKIEHPFGNVEQMDYKIALEKHKPNMVLIAWMPYEKDWSTDVRAIPSVEEYILMGEPASTGTPWETWGEPDHTWDDEEMEEYKNEPPPFEKDGFEKKDLPTVSSKQIFRRTIVGGYTGTFSFRRKDAAKE